MKRTGSRRRRAVRTAGAALVVGTLIVGTAAVGRIFAPQPEPAPAGTAVQGPLQPELVPSIPKGPPPVPRAVAAELHDYGCADPVTRGAGLRLTDPRRTALLIGDSQSAGALGVPGDRTWTQAGLRGAGYDVRFLGAGGTGFVAGNGTGGLNYFSALTRGRWILPCSDPGLIVVEGGGNDATLGASDAQILRGADALITPLTRYYPTSTIVLVGPVARGTTEGGGRRTEVDTLLGSYAHSHNLPFISTGDWLTRHGAETLMADDVHLTQAGHDRIAAALTAELRALRLTSADLLAAARGAQHFADVEPH
jgi:acyl-CoA thioesterase-1